MQRNLIVVVSATALTSALSSASAQAAPAAAAIRVCVEVVPRHGRTPAADLRPLSPLRRPPLRQQLPRVQRPAATPKFRHTWFR